MAGLHGTVSLCAAAIHSAPISVGTQLHAALCRRPLGLVGADRPASVTEILWDSIATEIGNYINYWQKVAIAIPAKRPQSLASLRLRVRRVLTVGRQ